MDMVQFPVEFLPQTSTVCGHQMCLARPGRTVEVSTHTRRKRVTAVADGIIPFEQHAEELDRPDVRIARIGDLRGAAAQQTAQFLLRETLDVQLATGQFTVLVGFGDLAVLLHPGVDLIDNGRFELGRGDRPGLDLVEQRTVVDRRCW
ncbi:MAG: hypothetical protein CMD83_07015 [Gammaproteobacteria bacterium]|nr:hypothetical protein [Gammaproteobacteria bacterium]